MKISELPSASTIAGTEIFPIVQSGETRKATLNDCFGLEYGTFTPSFTYDGTVDYIDFQGCCYYTKIGNVVTLSGKFYVEFLDTTLVSQSTFEPPISSNFDESIIFVGSNVNSMFFDSVWKQNNWNISVQTTNLLRIQFNNPANGYDNVGGYYQFTLIYKIT